MMKQKHYLAPTTEMVNVTPETSFLSGSNWLNQGGQGNFTFSTEDDDEFA